MTLEQHTPSCKSKDFIYEILPGGKFLQIICVDCGERLTFHMINGMEECPFSPYTEKEKFDDWMKEKGFKND